MENLKRISKNSVYQAGAFAAQGVTEFIVAVFLARSAGAERLGEFTTLVILAGLCAFIANFGLPSLLTREIARQREDSASIRKLIDAAFGLVMLLSVFALIFLITVGIVSNYSEVLLRALLFTWIALTFESLALIVVGSFRGVEMFEKSSIITAVMHSMFLLLALAVIANGASIDGLMAMYCLSRVIAFAVAVMFYRSHFGALKPTVDRILWHMLLKKGFPFSVNSIFAFAYSRADVVILSYLAGNVAVGYYEAAYTMTMRMNIVARALTAALYPFLSAQFVQDTRSMRAYVAKGIHLLVIAGFFIATILWLFGHEFINLIYSETFAIVSGEALKLLALVVPLRFVETLLAVTMDASNRAGQRATIVAIAGIINAALNFMLVPGYQMMGAVYSTMLTEVVILGIYIWHMRNEAREIIPWRAFVSPSLGSLMIALGLFVLNPTHLWLSITISVLVYGLVVVAMDRSTLERVP